MVKVEHLFRGVRTKTRTVRWLHSQEDGDALRALIKACDGTSYSYTSLYTPNVLEDLWTHQKFLSLGEFNQENLLIGHTGLWRKDPKKNYIESGLSCIHPKHRQHANSDHDQRWKEILQGLSSHFPYIHQCTTTLHPMAQYYALAHMRALPAGLIAFYAQNERVVGLHETGEPMHALCMTTVLQPQTPLSPLWLPNNRWSAWLQTIANTLGLSTQEDHTTDPLPSGNLELIENNTSLGLRRQLLTGNFSAELAQSLQTTPARIELIHAPAHRGIGAIAQTLESLSFLPVAVRPHTTRPHEIIFQHTPNPHQTASALQRAKLATKPLIALWQGWIEQCAHTL